MVVVRKPRLRRWTFVAVCLGAAVRVLLWKPQEVTTNDSDPLGFQVLHNETRAQGQEHQHVCQEEPIHWQPVQQVEGFPVYSNHSQDFFVFHHKSTHDPIKYKVCEFVINSKAPKQSFHFAHAMQQLYGCWTYWNAQEQAFTHNPQNILMVEPSVMSRLRQNSFLQGFLDMLKTQGIVAQIVSNVPSEWMNQSAHMSISVPGGYILEHAGELRHAVWEYLNMTTRPVVSISTKTSPRITILNRRIKKGRSLLNVEQLQQRISAKVCPDCQVQIEYMEGKSFEQQIDVMSRTDLLISPHGAQLTSVVMLPPPCGHVLEVFPKGYFLPSFYGSLSTAAGHKYFVWDLATKNSSLGNTTPSFAERVRIRKASLCPPMDGFAQAVTELITSWRKCMLISK